MRNFKTIAMLVAVLGLAMVASAAPWSATDGFESYTPGTTVDAAADWYAGGSGPTIGDTNGVNGSNGLGFHSNIFTWSAHPFSWADLAVGDTVSAGMDFSAATAAEPFDDDRVGWMRTASTVNSNEIMAVQMDPGTFPGGSGQNIEAYWEGVSVADVRTTICNVPTSLTAGNWYRLTATWTKTSTANEPTIAVLLESLDGSGNPLATVASGSLDTRLLSAGSRPQATYFTNTELWPSYKNYDSGLADNAYFAVVPEPASMGLLALGGLALLRRRTKR